MTTVHARSSTDKPSAVGIAAQLHDLGFKIVATGGTAQAISRMGVPVERINAAWVLAGRRIGEPEEAGVLLRTRNVKERKLGVPLPMGPLAIFENVGGCVDDLCIVRSMHTDIPNHEPSLMMLNCGDRLPGRPSMGSWLTYGLGTENQNLPGFITICPTLGHGGVQNWSSAFLPADYQGTPIGNASIPSDQARVKFMGNARTPKAVQRRQLDETLSELKALRDEMAQVLGD